VLWYTADAPEPQTRDYPGSPGGVEIYKITRAEDNRPIDLEQIPDQFMRELEQAAMDHANEEDMGAKEYAAEEQYTRRKEQQHGEDEDAWLDRLRR
jgi:hypothetical protein